jgi:hypothetical protein
MTLATPYQNEPDGALWITRRSLLAASLTCLTASLSLAEPAEREPATLLIFQNSFWVNLHHFLRAEARRSSHQMATEVQISDLLQDEATQWQAALSLYQGHAKNSLLFDPTLRDICNHLSQTRDQVTQLGQDQRLGDDTRRALNAAAPIYRKYLWNRHASENDRWIALYSPLARRYENDARRDLEAIFEVKLPRRPLLIDLAREVGPTLAYTFTPSPRKTAGHTVLAPQKNNDADTAMDTVFHELWHTVDQHVVEEVDREASRQRRKVPPDLWHALGLYTTGAIVQHLLGKQDDEHYKPKIALIQMFSSPEWSGLYKILEETWKPYLLGRIPRKQALENVIKLAAITG